VGRVRTKKQRLQEAARYLPAFADERERGGKGEKGKVGDFVSSSSFPVLVLPLAFASGCSSAQDSADGKEKWNIVEPFHFEAASPLPLPPSPLHLLISPKRFKYRTTFSLDVHHPFSDSLQPHRRPAEPLRLPPFDRNNSRRTVAVTSFVVSAAQAQLSAPYTASTNLAAPLLVEHLRPLPLPPPFLPSVDQNGEVRPFSSFLRSPSTLPHPQLTTLLPLSLKIASLFLRTLSKPIANKIKQQAKEHEGFKSRTVTMAQWLHRAECVFFFLFFLFLLRSFLRTLRTFADLFDLCRMNVRPRLRPFDAYEHLLFCGVFQVVEVETDLAFSSSPSFASASSVNRQSTSALLVKLELSTPGQIF
jgi:hypothetical protein